MVPSWLNESRSVVRWTFSQGSPAVGRLDDLTLMVTCVNEWKRYDVLVLEKSGASIRDTEPSLIRALDRAQELALKRLAGAI